nr:unnamed protein product [Callosobruchus analis]
MFVGIQFSEKDGGGVALVHQKWMTPRKGEVWWPPYKQQDQCDRSLKRGDSPNENWVLYPVERFFFEERLYSSTSSDEEPPAKIKGLSNIVSRKVRAESRELEKALTFNEEIMDKIMQKIIKLITDENKNLKKRAGKVKDRVKELEKKITILEKRLNKEEELGMKIGHVNVCSLTPKINYKKDLLVLENISILGITETWLSYKIPNELIDIDGYHFYKADRGSRGAGVGVYVRNNIDASKYQITSQESRASELLLDTYGLKQIVNDPTRKKSLLDIIVISNTDLVNSEVIHLDMHGITDHQLVLCNLLINLKKPPIKMKTYRDFKLFYFEEFERDLKQLEWADLYNANNIEDKVQLFTNKLMQLFDNHAPLVTRRISKPKDEWYADCIKVMTEERNRRLSKYKHTKNENDWREYADMRNLVKNGSSKGLWNTLQQMNVYSNNNPTLPDCFGDPNSINEYFIQSVERIDTKINDDTLYSTHRISEVCVNKAPYKTSSQITEACDQPELPLFTENNVYIQRSEGLLASIAGASTQPEPINNDSSKAETCLLRQNNERKTATGCVIDMPDVPVSLPVKQLHELLVFEKYLDNETKFSTLVLYFSIIIGGRDLKCKVNAILRHILTNHVTSSLSFLGSRNGKKLFCNLKLKKLITCTEVEITDAIKVWLKHAPKRQAAESKKRDSVGNI